MLDENAEFLTAEQLKSHVKLLNGDGVQIERYLSYEWEVAVLNALSKVGLVQHEKDFGGKSRPDIHFSSPADEKIISLFRAISPQASQEIDRLLAEITGEEEDENFAFIADIATVSDEGIQNRNPVEAFVKEFVRILSKNGLTHGFSYQIGSYNDREFARHRIKVKLPLIGELNAKIFQTAEFKSFVRAVKKDASVPHSITFQGDDIDLSLSYHPQARHLSGGQPSYRSVSKSGFDPKARNLFDANLKHNGVYAALKSKADQLRKSGFEGRRGIIVCDGGCQLLSDTGMMQTRTSPEVVAKFLRESSSVDFVILIHVAMVEPPRPPSNILTSRLLTPSWFNRVPQLHLHVDANPRLLETSAGIAFAKELTSVAFAARLCFFSPVSNADNAVNWLKGYNPHQGRSGIDFKISIGYDMNPTELSFSARELLEVLAGKKSLQKFLQNYGFAPSDDPDDSRQTESNPFENLYDAGCLIREASVEISDDKDDDRITLRFGNPDPAIAPFRVPSKTNAEEHVEDKNEQ